MGTTSDEHKGAGHRKRLRERFLRGGLAAFQDYEIIELLLTLGTPRRDCKDQAKEALKRFKSLRGVLEAPSKELQAIDGIGAHSLFGIKLAKAVAELYTEKQLKPLARSQPISSSTELFNYLYTSMRDKFREQFKVVYLDAKNRILSTETLFEGTLTATSVYPREVIRSALQQNAAAVIFVHNHPSGDPRPSNEDIAITRRLVNACRSIDVTVHEHLIIGDDKYYSFADSGHMAETRETYHPTSYDAPDVSPIALPEQIRK